MDFSRIDDYDEMHPHDFTEPSHPEWFDDPDEEEGDGMEEDDAWTEYEEGWVDDHWVDDHWWDDDDDLCMGPV